MLTPDVSTSRGHPAPRAEHIHAAGALHLHPAAPKEVAKHLSMSLRGVEAASATTLTSSRLRTAGVHLRNTSGLDREGQARAQQLAALAAGDEDRRDLAEGALASALADRVQRAAVTDKCLCHGTAGLALVAGRVAADAGPGAASLLRTAIPGLLDAIHARAASPPNPVSPASTAAALISQAGAGPGFLEGAAGIALAVHAASTVTPPLSGWDTCLLIA